MDTQKTTGETGTGKVPAGGVSGLLKDYLSLIKVSLSIMVVFSSVIAFLLTPGADDYVDIWNRILWLFVGGMLVTGSANAINQVVEKDTDAVMKRTAKRPVASGRMSVQHGWAFAVITGIAGVLILGFFFQHAGCRPGRFQFVPVRVYLHAAEESKFNRGAGRCDPGSTALPDRLGGRQ